MCPPKICVQVLSLHKSIFYYAKFLQFGQAMLFVICGLIVILYFCGFGLYLEFNIILDCIKVYLYFNHFFF